MGVGGSDNAWWMDVLEWGRQSPYARVLRHRLGAAGPQPDQPPARALPRRALRRGAGLGRPQAPLRARRRGKFAAWYYEHRFPIAPQHYHHILVAAGDPAFDPARATSSAASGCASATAPRRGPRRSAPGRRSGRSPRPEGGAAKIERGARRLRPEDGGGARPAAPAAGTPALPPRVVARRGGRDQLAPLLRHHLARRLPGRGAGSLRRLARAGAAPLRRGRGRRRAHRPRGRPRRPARLLPQAAPAHAVGAAGPRAADLGGEDPGALRGAAHRLDGGRHQRLRLHGRGGGRAARPGRRGAALRALDRDHRPLRRVRGRGARGAAADPAREPDQRAERHRRGAEARGRPRPRHPRLHPHRAAPRADGGAGRTSRSTASTSRRAGAAPRTSASSTGRWPARGAPCARPSGR